MSASPRTRPAAYGESQGGFSDEVHDTADRIVRRYPVARSALLPLLHLVQSVHNHVTDDGIAFCAEKVGLTRAEVGAVATFYTMYKREPVGDWLLSVCTNPVCKQAGGQQILDNYVEALGGHSDAETRVTVEHAECLGICDAAPTVQVNYEMFGPMTVAEGDELLAACRKGEPPTSPWSGEAPPTFAEVEYDLSGANDAWEDQLHLAAQQQIAYEVPPTYRTGETDVPVTHPGGDPAGIGGAAFRAAAAGTVPAPAPQAAASTLPDDELPGGPAPADVAAADATTVPAGTQPPAVASPAVEDQDAADAVQGSDGDGDAGGADTPDGAAPEADDDDARTYDAAAPAAQASDQPDADTAVEGPADEGLEDDPPATQPSSAAARDGVTHGGEVEVEASPVDDTGVVGAGAGAASDGSATADTADDPVEGAGDQPQDVPDEVVGTPDDIGVDPDAPDPRDAADEPDADAEAPAEADAPATGDAAAADDEEQA